MVDQLILLRKRSSLQRDGPGSVSKAFLRKTAKGRVFRVLREQYLRDDIPCGSLACSLCEDFYHRSSAPHLAEDSEQGRQARRAPSAFSPILSKRGRPALESLGKHYLVIDTNVVLHQMDVLENSSFGADIIILQTVLDEVRHRSLPLYNRLRALLAEPDRRMCYFANEACGAAFAQRQDGETPNNYNDRAIRMAAHWYKAHLGDTAHARKRRRTDSDTLIEIVLLTDDADNRRRARDAHLTAFSVREYLSLLPKDISGALLDLVADAGNEIEAEAIKGQRGALYTEHLPLAELQANIRHGRFFQGHYTPNPYNYLEGSVNVPNLDKPVLLSGRENINRATDGDVVAVELLPEAQWKTETDETINADATLRDEDPDDSGGELKDGAVEEERRLAKLEQRAAKRDARKRAMAPQPTGKVIGIVKRAWRAYVCHLDRSSLGPATLESNAPQNVFAMPVDRKFPKIRIRTRQAGSLVNQKFLVTVDKWDATSRYPEGHFVRALGGVETKEAEIESLLLEFDVPYRPFSKAILDCLPAEGDNWIVPPKNADSIVWRGREDLRDLTICSIDPPGCQDIDDALHARRLANGNIEAGVHIADVSHFVHPDTAMDAEAASRGTTVYLVDKRIDMLPSLLGTNLCSLRPFVERLAFSVIWELDQEANIVKVRFTKSVIASKSAFTYEEAQMRKDNPALDDDISQGIRLLNTVATLLRAKRMAAGALNLASPEVKIFMETSEDSGPINVEQKEMLQTNSLVEEFMLLANISVAQRIYEQFPQTAVLRRHAPPPSSNFEVLKDVLLKRKGLSLDTSSSRALARSLDACEDPHLPEFNTLVRIMATRCMLSAEYFCSGSIARDAFTHYGLASPIYTHFTSPIRRYADVLAHRELLSAISGATLHAAMHSRSHVDRTLENINKRHRAAQRAARASVEFYVALSLRRREEVSIKAGLGKIREEAFVIRVFRNGIAVFASRLGLEGLVTFKRDYTYDADKYELALQDTQGQEVRLGVFDKVTVEISVDKEKNTQRGRVRMRLLDPLDSEAM